MVDFFLQPISIETTSVSSCTGYFLWLTEFYTQDYIIVGRLLKLWLGIGVNPLPKTCMCYRDARCPEGDHFKTGFTAYPGHINLIGSMNTVL